METKVIDNPERDRFEVHVNGTLAGFVAYDREDGVVTFTHTEIGPAFEGHGLGSVLARSALDQVRGAGKQVVPQCPFITSYIRRHREYVDLVVPERRGAFQETADGS